MANRVPLIVDTTNLHLKELPLGDALDLTGCSIVGLTSFTPGSGGGQRFIGITTFGDGTGAATTGVYVNDGLLANYLKASNLTDNQVVTAGAGGSITASSNLTFDESTLAVTGALTVSGDVDLGDAAADTITATGKFDSSLIPASDSVNLGSSTDEWGDLYIDGTANIDALVADSAKIVDVGDTQVLYCNSADGEVAGSANLTFSGTKLTVTGDLDVTGSLNYTNVTDIYSVGIITAAGTVEVGAGISVLGNIGDTAEETDCIALLTGNGPGYAHTAIRLRNLGTTDNSGVRITHTMIDDGDNKRDACYINMVAEDTNASGEQTSIDFWTTLSGTTARHMKLFAGDSHGNRGVGIGTNGDVNNGRRQSRATLDVDGCVHIEGYSNQVGVATFSGAVTANAGLTANTATIQAGDDADANLYLYADNGDDDVDKWLMQSESEGYFALKNKASGSWETSVKATGNLSVDLYYDNTAKFGTSGVGASVYGTGALNIPVGTTLQRPTDGDSPQNGDIRYNTDLNSYEGYGNGAWGGLGGGTEIDETITSTSAQNLTTFAKADYRSASLRIQIVQGSAYQVGRYLLIHDDTTATIVEEAAIATGSMLGTISAAINGSNVEVKVTMGSASSATITTIIDKISV